MIQASICTIGDEILIGQVVDTNSSRLAIALEEAGIRVTRMLSIGDDRDEILNNLRNELTINDIVLTTGGLGPTKDDITKGSTRGSWPSCRKSSAAAGWTCSPATGRRPWCLTAVK